MAKELKLYNSLTARKERFVPLDAEHVRMYVCGPTLYSNPHLGNARSTVIYDLLYRVLKEIYPKVTYARNITDIDDKINDAAKEKQISIQELTKEVREEFNSDMHALCNLKPDIEPSALENIDDIINLIELLISRKNAYIAAGHVYFSVKSFRDYGKLSGRAIEEMLQGVRIEVAEAKKAPEDFVLWKPAKETDDDSAKFQSPWGIGRPGWHIECSLMSTKFLGKDFDIHGGGADLKFPHHENEIAQSCAAYPDSKYAKYWVHNGFLTVHGEKMSKSLGNFITVKELLQQGVKGRCLRLILLTTHYRKPLDYNFKVLEESRAIIARYDRILNEAKDIDVANWPLPGEFLDLLLNDLNVAEAMAYLYELSKEIYSFHQEDQIKDFKRIAQFLGFEQNGPAEIPLNILAMAKEIQTARATKDYQKADEIRVKIINLGYEINYTKSGEIEVIKK
ncbi:MAG: cysteine--tRNA ligase [Rickettsiales bacterium]